MPKGGKVSEAEPSVQKSTLTDDIILLLIILAGAAVSWLLVWPVGNFPLNDDWAYASSVRHLLDEGRFVLSDWSAPFDLIPILSGALLTKLFGFHHEIFRLCTWLWYVLGLFCFAKLLEIRGVDRQIRLLACLTLGFTPIAFLLGFSFHTDIPFLSLVLGALYFFERAENHRSAWDEFWASIFAAGALLTRQSGAVLFASFLLWRLIRRRFSASTFLQLGAVPVLGIVFYFWYIHTHTKTWAEVNYLAGGTMKHLSSFGLFAQDITRWALDSMLYAGLFCSPFFFVAAPGKQKINFGRDALFMIGAIGLGIYLSNRGSFPYLENIFQRHGLGTLTVYKASTWKPAFVWGWKSLWLAYTVFAGVSLWTFLRRLAMSSWDEVRLRLLFVTGMLALSTLSGSRYFDRYTLEWILCLLLSLSLVHRQSAVRWPAWAMAGFWIVLSIVGSRDYFVWNRARWEFGLEAARYGFAPEEVANGFDWNAHWKFEKNMAELKKQKPLENISEWEWERMDRTKAVITFSPDFMPKENLIAEKTYTSLLALRGGKLYLFSDDRKTAP